MQVGERRVGMSIIGVYFAVIWICYGGFDTPKTWPGPQQIKTIDYTAAWKQPLLHLHLYA